MPAYLFREGLVHLLCIAGQLSLSSAFSAPQHSSSTRSTFARAQKMREALEGRPERQRTRRDYERVMDAYRTVYHANPRSPHADASISAVADLLAEEGRIFQDNKALHDAIGQYEFLRANYPQSRYRYSALLTIGEVYLRDLDDPENARASFEQFLKLYPQNPLAVEARIELSNLRRGHQPPHRTVTIAQAEEPTPPPTHRKQAAHTNEQTANPSLESRRAASTTTAAGPSQRNQKQELAETDMPPSNTRAPQPLPVSESDLNATPPPRKNRLPLVIGIRYWSTPVYTRVAIDLEDEVQYQAVRVPRPDRIFFDLHGTRLSPELVGKSDQVIDDGFLK